MQMSCVRAEKQSKPHCVVAHGTDKGVGHRIGQQLALRAAENLLQQDIIHVCCIQGHAPWPTPPISLHLIKRP